MGKMTGSPGVCKWFGGLVVDGGMTVSVNPCKTANELLQKP
jgi:hypothetical protein